MLFAAACAYRVPGAGVKDFVPSTLFPDYRPRSGGREDHRDEVVLDFEYATPAGHHSMRWRRRSKGWNRSFGSRKNASQPERAVYLRTLGNLGNPSEVRGVLSISRLAKDPEEKALTASQVELAHQMLPFRYSEVVKLSSGSKTLLFAAQDGGGAYSELHMSAGERTILRLSQDIAQLKGAHPHRRIGSGAASLGATASHGAIAATGAAQRSAGDRHDPQPGGAGLGAEAGPHFSRTRPDG